MDGNPKRQTKRAELCGAGKEIPHGPADSEAVRGVTAETEVHILNSRAALIEEGKDVACILKNGNVVAVVGYKE